MTFAVWNCPVLEIWKSATLLVETKTEAWRKPLQGVEEKALEGLIEALSDKRANLMVSRDARAKKYLNHAEIQIKKTFYYLSKPL